MQAGKRGRPQTITKNNTEGGKEGDSIWEIEPFSRQSLGLGGGSEGARHEGWEATQARSYWVDRGGYARPS